MRKIFQLSFYFALLPLLPLWADQAAWEQLMKQSTQAIQAGDGEKGLDLALAALSAAKDAAGEDNLMQAETYYLLGELNFQLGRLADAITAARKSFLIRSNLLGNEAMEVAISANSLAQLYQDVGRYEDAAPLNEQTILIWRKELGESHPNLSVPLNNQGKIHFIAALYFEERASQSKDPTEAASLRNEMQKNLELSRTYFQESMQILQKNVGEHDPNIGACQQNLGDVYYKLGDTIEAEDMYRKGLKNLGKALGPTNPHVVKCMTSLATACHANGKNADAEKYYEAALKYTSQSTIKGQLDHVLELSRKMAAFFEAIGNKEKAVACYAQATLIEEQIAEARSGK